MIKFTLIGSLFLIMACNGAKENAAAPTAEKMEQEKKMLSQGFTKGTIVHSKEEGDCEYTIKLEDGRYFESVDLNDEYKKNDMEVWFTYRPLRRMSQCQKANPVGITDMKKG